MKNLGALSEEELRKRRYSKAIALGLFLLFCPNLIYIIFFSHYPINIDIEFIKVLPIFEKCYPNQELIRQYPKLFLNHYPEVFRAYHATYFGIIYWLFVGCVASVILVLVDSFYRTENDRLFVFGNFNVGDNFNSFLIAVWGFLFICSLCYYGVFIDVVNPENCYKPNSTMHRTYHSPIGLVIKLWASLPMFVFLVSLLGLLIKIPFMREKNDLQ
jgi:Serpentine type 7TM GPCR chemoreceptor Srv